MYQSIACDATRSVHAMLGHASNDPPSACAPGDAGALNNREHFLRSMNRTAKPAPMSAPNSQRAGRVAGCETISMRLLANHACHPPAHQPKLSQTNHTKPTRRANAWQPLPSHPNPCHPLPHRPTQTAIPHNHTCLPLLDKHAHLGCVSEC